MRQKPHLSVRKNRKTGRRHPLATVALLALALGMTGGAYAVFNSSTASAETQAASQQSIDGGKKLFMANCATCHGLQAQGSDVAPSLVGVGAAAVDFQVGTGRMPLAMNGPQAEQKPPQFTEEQTAQLAAYVASLAPGPAIPEGSVLDTNGDLANGGVLFRTNCAMCHNVAGAGGALTEGKFAPPLHGVSPKHAYEAMETGPQSMPVFNDANISQSDKRDIISYLNFLETNPSPGGYDLGSFGPVSEGLFLWIFGLGAVVGITVWITAKSN